MTPQEQLAKSITASFLSIKGNEDSIGIFISTFDNWAASPEGSALIAKIGQQGGVWKPIKTASKDGNTIRVSYEIDGSDSFLVKWVDERTCAGDRKYGPGWAQTEIPAGEGLPVDEPLMWYDESPESSPTQAEHSTEEDRLLQITFCLGYMQQTEWKKSFVDDVADGLLKEKWNQVRKYLIDECGYKP